MNDNTSADFVKKIKSNSVTSKQKEILVEFISNRPEMYTGKLTASYTREKMKKLWTELANTLNSVPGGPAKEWLQWRKTWVDLKKNSKAKLSLQKKHFRETGGGPPLPPSDSKYEDKSIEDKLLTIISPVSVSGNMNINESKVQFDFEDEIVNFSNTSSAEPDVELCETSGFTEVTHVEHDYVAGSSKQFEMTNTTENCNPITTKRKKVTKTTRLTESLKNNKKFLEVNEEHFKSEKEYRQKKIEILQRDSENRRLYQERKLTILNDLVLVATDISADIKMLREHLTE